MDVWEWVSCGSKFFSSERVNDGVIRCGSVMIGSVIVVGWEEVRFFFSKFVVIIRILVLGWKFWIVFRYLICFWWYFCDDIIFNMWKEV